MKQLLVVDSGTLLQQVRQILEPQGWTIFEGSMYEQVLDIAKRHTPDLVFLNLDTPKIDGYELVTQLKLDPVTCAIPILVVSLLDRAPSRFGGVPVDSMALPLDPQVFLAKLQRLLANHLHEQAYVLIVDDEPDLVDILSTALGGNGFFTSSASDGQQALEIVEQVQPDAIVLDLDMPRVNGWQVLEQLKQSEKFSAIRVVILTGVATTHKDQRTGLARGADAYLLKPCSMAHVIQTLQTVLRRRERAPGGR